MKIKYRITLLFTLVVSIILLLLCLSIYYASEVRRQDVLDQKLRNRAQTTVNLLLTINGINKDLLRRIDESTFVTVYEKSLVVYNELQQEIYAYADSNATVIRIGSAGFKKLLFGDEYSFDKGKSHVLVVNYLINKKKYTVVSSAFDEDGIERITALKFILLISFISGIFITFISGLLFSYNIVAAIKKITEEVKEISSKNLSRRIILRKPKDELYKLSDTFNELLSRLEESFKVQRHFISNASHELSTPLTSILSQLEVTLQYERGKDEYKSVLFSVYEDVKNLNQLTRSLLEVAKASGSSDGMKLALVRIDELLMKLPSDLHRIDQRYLVNLQFMTFPDDEKKLLIFGNLDLLYIAVKNVVQNACKYGADHTATVSLLFSEGLIDILVTDNGPGIGIEEQELIFQPFYRTVASRDKQKGFGLGLSLALRIIKLHKGEIKLASAGDTGTCFTIRFPVAEKF